MDAINWLGQSIPIERWEWGLMLVLLMYQTFRKRK